ncbi:MAG: YHS domain-containing protein [Nitrospirae bacterium]|nr:YHS domain-containing protein [Nitrospirota bacterium]MBI5695479.1 YHS domain-containing protein [Nitrospirota bacterium]
MKPPVVDPVCGMACGESPLSTGYQGNAYKFCSEGCMDAFRKDPERFKDNTGVRGRYTLSFLDTKTEKPVLTVPVIFKGSGDRTGDKTGVGHGEHKGNGKGGADDCGH